MSYQSEAELENQLIKQLNDQGYMSVAISNYDGLLDNFRKQFTAFNIDKLGGNPLSDKEWDRLLNYMLGRSVFESAKVLRDKYGNRKEKVHLYFNYEIASLLKKSGRFLLGGEMDKYNFVAHQNVSVLPLK